jgi:hypothetical protein
MNAAAWPARIDLNEGPFASIRLERGIYCGLAGMIQLNAAKRSACDPSLGFAAIAVD